MLVGPNCLGMVDNSTELYLSSDAFEPGSVALLSQSGNVALEVQFLLARRGLGFSRFVSLGNQAGSHGDRSGRGASRTSRPEQSRSTPRTSWTVSFAAAAGAAVAAGKPVVCWPSAEAPPRPAARHPTPAR
jgi:hypothetical protein